MFNPLLPDLSKIKQDELVKKIGELSQKYQGSRNQNLRNQIFVILEQYRQEYSDRLRVQMEKDSKQLDKVLTIE